MRYFHCDSCGHYGPDVDYVIDPYMEDVFNTIVYTYLCHKWEGDARDDI